MTYLPAGPHNQTDGSAVFVFTDLVESANFEGKEGSFAAQGKGSFDAAKFTVHGNFDIVPGSGEGELGELFNNRGTGSFESDPDKPHGVDYMFVVNG